MNFSLSPYAPGQEMPLYNFGNQDAEEERKRKELQARMDAQARQAMISDEAVASGGMAPVAPVAPEVTPIKETRTIDPTTGETKIKIEGSEKDLSAANPNTPSYTGAKAPVSPQAFNQQQYNASIGAQESGNRPTIGFHDRNKSSAFGQYGLTNAAYQDARRLNPNLPADITQATPEQQNQAMNSFTQQNARALQSYGIEPNQNTLAAAHFLGARGLNDFMTKKDEQGRPYISPQAQAANGGYDKAAQIANARLGGQAAAASGATNMPTAVPGPGVAVATGQGVQGTMTNQPVSPEQVSQQPLPANQGIKIPGLPTMAQMGQQATSTEATQTPLQMGIQRFQDNQDNLDELVKMRNDQSIPEHLRKRSADRAYELMNQQYKQSQAQSKLDSMVANGDQMGIAKALASKPKDEEGSWLKMLALGFISPQLAGQEAIKLGLAPTKWEGAVITDKDGNDIGVEIQRRSDGKILGGTRSDGTALTSEELNQVTGIAQNMKTLATQANQSATHSMDAMRKENQLARNANLPAPYTEDQIVQRGKEVYRQTMSVSRASPIGTNKPMTQVTQGATAETTTTTPTAKTGVLENWNVQRPGEDMKAYAKRQQIRPQDIESAAAQLAEGRVKPSDLGYTPEFRKMAVLRAEEISGKAYSPQLYDQINNVIKRYTSGEDHKTLVNTGTAVNHLLQFKEVANSIPIGQTGVSSWNTFIQNLSKYGEAPEFKSKEAMAEFVAGELVKAATGAQGGVSERQALEKKIMEANTPKEIAALVDNSIKLAHGRYGSLKSSYEATTKRKDFDDIAGMPREAKQAFAKLEGQDAAKAGSYSDAEKEARYQEWKRKQGIK